MNPLTTLDRPATPARVSALLSRNGFHCSLVEIDPGAEFLLAPSNQGDDELFYVLEGALNVRCDDVSTVVDPGSAHLAGPGQARSLDAFGNHRVRFLRTEIPPRQIVSPQIITPR